MRRRTKGGLAGLAAFTVLAVIGEISGGDAADVQVTADSDATAGDTSSTDDRAPSATRTAVPSPPSTPTATAPSTATAPFEEPPPEAESAGVAAGDDPDRWTVIDVVDGDTIDVARGGVIETVRMAGIDTPERGQCGYDEATAALRDLVGGTDVELVGAGNDNRDAYGRLIRYVDRGDIDAGYEQITAGMAIARYDSRDGYGRHPRQDRYIAADDVTDQGYSCTAPDEEPAPGPDAGAEPWNQPGPDLDCADIGQRVRITGEDYHRLDADGDGWGCESYG